MMGQCPGGSRQLERPCTFGTAARHWWCLVCVLVYECECWNVRLQGPILEWEAVVEEMEGPELGQML